MAKDQTVAVAADVLKADAAALAALAKIAGYTPANAEFALTKLQTASAANKAAADAFAQAEADWQTARDGNVAAQWAFHNAILGAKQQVVAQFGDDSDEEGEEEDKKRISLPPPLPPPSQQPPLPLPPRLRSRS